MFKKVHRHINEYMQQIDKLWHSEHYPYGAILLLHRIGVPNPSRLHANEHLKIRPELLESFIVRARKMGFEFVSLDELKRYHENGRIQRRKLLAITLDDGYADNYELGLPLFRKLQVPFCIYVAPGFVEGTTSYWWYMLEDLVLRLDQLQIVSLGNIDCFTREQKEEAFLKIRRHMLLLSPAELAEFCHLLFARYANDEARYKIILPLKLNQLQELSAEPLCTIGAHTYSHCSFAGLGATDIDAELTKCQQSLFNLLAIDATHFAFPFGDLVAMTQEGRDCLQNSKYHTVATSDDGVLGPNTDYKNLPRLFLSEDNMDLMLKRLSLEV